MFPSCSNVFIKPPQAIHLDTTNAVENIKYFRRQWELYERITGIDKLDEEVKTSVLYSLMGEAACSLADSLLLQRIAENRNADSILSALENHFSSYANVLYERYVFSKIEQNDDETVDSFANRVRRQAAKCDFRDHTHDFVRDRFIVGLANENLRNFLLRKNSLTFEDAYNVSKIVEEDGENLTTLAPSAHLGGDPTPSVSPPLIRSLHPTCPSEELVLSVHSRSPAIKNAGCGAVRSPPSYSQLFPSQNCHTYPSANPSQVHQSRLRNKPEIESCVARVQHLRYSTRNLPQPAENVENKDASSLQCGTASLKKFGVGTYVVQKRDLKSARANLSIWKVCSPSFLQEFTPYINQNGVIEYVNYGMHITHTDRRWLSSKEKYYAPVAIADETVKVDFFGRQVTTVRLEEDIFKRRKAKTAENAKNTANLPGNVAAIDGIDRQMENLKLKKTATGKVKKINRDRKIRHQICLSLTSLMCCCI